MEEMHLEEPKENAGNDLQYNLCYKNNNNNKLLAKLPDLDILIFFFQMKVTLRVVFTGKRSEVDSRSPFHFEVAFTKCSHVSSLRWGNGQTTGRACFPTAPKLDSHVPDTIVVDPINLCCWGSLFLNSCSWVKTNDCQLIWDL